MREFNSRGAVKAVEYVVITNDGIMEGRMMQMDGVGQLEKRARCMFSPVR